MNQNNVDKIFKAFADHSRLRILSLLAHGELCVCDLIDVLKMGQSKVSRHLSYLKRTGLVEARKEGLWVYYALAKPTGKFERKLFDCLDCCFDDVPMLARDMKTLQKKKKSGC